MTYGSPYGTRTVQCCWGLCKFTDLVIAKSGQRYVLQFDSPGVKTTFTQPFEVFGPSTLNVLRQPRGAVSKSDIPIQPRVFGPSTLNVLRQPSGAVSDSDIPIQPRVRVTDTLGELMVRCQRDACQIGGAAEVTASIKVGTGGLTLHSIAGTLVEPVVDGVANFTNLVIFGAGASFR
ncbi:hypothetical protein T484DRAFT_1763883 [Baffinella frigidus]|nr:hypothetical protein T484DRAFT_1763883 [Cryptophyta sp. CCMP2293]